MRVGRAASALSTDQRAVGRRAAVRGALLVGAAAGAAGTTALNAVTYLDMAVRGRPQSRTPEAGIERLTGSVGLTVRGTGETRRSRVRGLGALTGIAVGVGVGAVFGLARSAGWRPAGSHPAATATALALVAGNAPMTVLGVSDPREWSVVDWLSDLVPHVAYGVVTAAVIKRIDHPSAVGQQ